jgi:hypothetical protein
MGFAGRHPAARYAWTALVTRWRVAGPYVEACSCEAICPCRVVGGRDGTRATYQLCQFAIAWTISNGHFSSVDLSGLDVVMAGYWDEDEAGTPWRVVLYVDSKAGEAESGALADIFLGRAGGTPSKNYAGAIRDVLAIRHSQIDINHARGSQKIRVGDAIEVRTRALFPSSETVTCGVPGLDRPGDELINDVMRVADPSFEFEFHGRCGFATDFDYSGD